MRPKAEGERPKNAWESGFPTLGNAVPKTGKAPLRVNSGEPLGRFGLDDGVGSKFCGVALRVPSKRSPLSWGSRTFKVFASFVCFHKRRFARSRLLAGCLPFPHPSQPCRFLDGFTRPLSRFRTRFASVARR